MYIFSNNPQQKKTNKKKNRTGPVHKLIYEKIIRKFGILNAIKIHRILKTVHSYIIYTYTYIILYIPIHIHIHILTYTYTYIILY